MKYNFPIGLFQIPVCCDTDKTVEERTIITRNNIKEKTGVTLPIVHFANNEFFIIFPDDEGNIIRDETGIGYNSIQDSIRIIRYAYVDNFTYNTYSAGHDGISLRSNYFEAGYVDANFYNNCKNKFLIIDTRFLETHNFYTLSLNSIKDVLFLPKVYITSFINLSNNKKINGYFSIDDLSQLSIIQPYPVFYTTSQTTYTNAGNFYSNYYHSNEENELLKKELNIYPLQIGSFLSEKFFYIYINNPTDNPFCSLFYHTKMNKEKDFYKKIQLNEEKFFISLSIPDKNCPTYAKSYSITYPKYLLLFKEEGE